jgi:MYXO-CTERM domain-containing protein
VTGSGWGGSSTTVNVGSGASPTITLLWTPPSLSAGSNGFLGTMNVTFMGMMFPVTIDGTPVEAEVLSNPPALDFGSVCGGATKTDPLVVYNEGNTNIDLTNAQAATNVFTASIPPTALIAGNGNQASGHVSLMAPTVMSAMMYSDAVTLTLSSGSAAPVPLSATVLPDGVIPLPNALDFGDVEATAVGSSFVLTNCASGGPTLSVTDPPTIGGADPDAFSLAAPTTFPLALAPAASQMFTLVMLPGSAGAKTATLTVNYAASAPATIVDLTGSNVVPAKPRDTFYACSTSGGAGGWPIVAAIGVCVFAWRRRRR